MNRSLQSLLLASAVIAMTPVQATYKIVGPDGRITYTDRAPASNEGRVQTINRSGVAAPELVLPLELRQASQRFPVTLFTTSNCSPCDEARKLLRERGIPHLERSVIGEEDREAWVRIVGGPEAPAILIGQQSLRGLQREEWVRYLDAAGYPRESRLPSNYLFGAPVPLVPRVAPEARTIPQPDTRAPNDPAQPQGFRF